MDENELYWDKKMKSSFEYSTIARYQKKSDDPFIKNFDTEEMYYEYEWMLRMFWLRHKDTHSYEELDALMDREIGNYFETEKHSKSPKQNKLKLISDIRLYFLQNKNHYKDDVDFQQILKDVDSLKIRKSIKYQYSIEYEYRKKQIIKNCLTAFFLKSNWE